MDDQRAWILAQSRGSIPSMFHGEFWELVVGLLLLAQRSTSGDPLNAKFPFVLGFALGASPPLPLPSPPPPPLLLLSLLHYHFLFVLFTARNWEQIFNITIDVHSNNDVMRCGNYTNTTKLPFHVVCANKTMGSVVKIHLNQPQHEIQVPEIVLNVSGMTIVLFTKTAIII